jgi:hypothetical protein
MSKASLEDALEPSSLETSLKANPKGKAGFKATPENC